MDTYTKIVLTIIGFSLLGILLKPIYLPEPVTAREIIAVDIAKVGGWSVQRSLPIKVVE